MFINRIYTRLYRNHVYLKYRMYKYKSQMSTLLLFHNYFKCGLEYQQFIHIYIQLIIFIKNIVVLRSHKI